MGLPPVTVIDAVVSAHDKKSDRGITKDFLKDEIRSSCMIVGGDNQYIVRGAGFKEPVLFNKGFCINGIFIGAFSMIIIDK